MGEVYRARDTSLPRAVALKILPDAFVYDAERIARFQREAQILASLNHPHIAAIHGVDEANGSQFLILELVDGYTLADRTVHMSPEGWGRAAVKAAIEFDADDIVVETNFGGEMAVAVIRGATDALGVNVPIRIVTASRGKKVRAEPVAALAERGRWHHAGVFPELEDQLCTWTDEAGYSPDRMDAMVWPAWHMRAVGTVLRSVGTFSGQMAAHRIG